jgi:hypothetical protein
MKRLGSLILFRGELRDRRIRKNAVHQRDGLFRKSGCGRLVSYEDVNVAARIALYHVMRQTLGGRACRCAGGFGYADGPVRD